MLQVGSKRPQWVKFHAYSQVTVRPHSVYWIDRSLSELMDLAFYQQEG